MFCKCVACYPLLRVRVLILNLPVMFVTTIIITSVGVPEKNRQKSKISLAI